MREGGEWHTPPTPPSMLPHLQPATALHRPPKNTPQGKVAVTHPPSYSHLVHYPGFLLFILSPAKTSDTHRG